MAASSSSEHASDASDGEWESVKPKGRGYLGAGQTKAKPRMSADRALELEHALKVDGLAKTLMTASMQKLMQQCDFVGIIPGGVVVSDGWLGGVLMYDLNDNRYGDRACFMPRLKDGHHAANLLLFMSGDNLLLRREGDKPLLVGQRPASAGDQSPRTGG